MPLVIDAESLRGELDRAASHKTKALSGVRLTEKVLLEAAPIIEHRLGDSRYLRQWTWNGKQAFFDDEPGGVKDIRSFSNKSNHLAFQFHVTPNVQASGYGGFVLHNDKEVSSRHGKFNLFDLLWYGFGPYIGPTPVKKFNRLSLTEINQMNWKQRRAWRTGTTFYLEPPMTFYYRYAGKWFYKRTKRGGFTPSLHDKFKQYIVGAIAYGIQNSIKNIIDSGEGSATMKRIWEETQ
jgi:hypothetical protein